MKNLTSNKAITCCCIKCLTNPDEHRTFSQSNHTNHFFFFSQNNILLRETGLEGGITATIDRQMDKGDAFVHVQSSSGLVSAQATGSKTLISTGPSLLSLSAPAENN